MEMLIKLGTQKESIIVLTKFSEKLPLISSFPWWIQAVFTTGFKQSAGMTCQGGAGAAVRDWLLPGASGTAV